MKLKITLFFEYLKKRVRRLFARKRQQPDFEKEVQSLKDQVDALYKVVREQSTIIVAVTKIQADLINSVSKIENKSPEGDCFLIKIPIRDDGIAN